MSDKSTKTICFFNSNNAWGGGEKWHLTTAKEFSRRGYNTFIVSNVHSELEKRGIEERMNVFSFFVHNLSFLNPFKILTMVALFKSQKVDAIVLNLPSDLKLAGVAAKIAGVKKIIYRRGMPHPLRNTALNRYLFKKVLTHVVVNSQEIGRSLKEGNESWFPKEKMVLIYNGVDTKKATAHEKKLYEKEGDEIVIGNAGRLTEQKGQKYLIEMAEMLKEEGMNFKLLIAGEGELEDSLISLIRERDLDNEVLLLGHVKDMTGFFNSLDVFVFTSLYEGSANTLIETLYHGIPTVAWDISSNPEVIEDGVSGYLVKPFEVEELAKTVEKVIQDKEVKKKLVFQDVVVKKFDSEKNLSKLEEIIS
jgi:glycosyltransferase involved in cell wall biosynthesis